MEQAVHRDEAGGTSGFLDYLLGPLVAIIVSFVLVLLFSLAVYFFSVPDNMLTPVNTAIKLVSIVVGVFVAMRRATEKGWIKGALTGLLFMTVGVLLYAVVSKQSADLKMWLTDLALGTIAGIISGILMVNLPKRSEKKHKSYKSK